MASSIHNLGWYWHVRGDYENAEELYRRAADIRQRLGQERDVVNAANLEGLGLVTRLAGDNEAAEQLLRDALAIRRDHLDPMHPDIGSSLNTLAYLLATTGRHEEADSLYNESLAIQREVYGVHIQTAQVLHDYATLLVTSDGTVRSFTTETTIDLDGRSVTSRSSVGVSDLDDTSVEDVEHEPLPTGARPPNRSWTIGVLFTHPGDSHQPDRTAPVMALPLMAPWTSTTDAVAFARRVGPRQVVPIHDFYMTEAGRGFITGLVANVLAEHDIELLRLDWGDTATIG